MAVIEGEGKLDGQKGSPLNEDFDYVFGGTTVFLEVKKVVH